jgi:DNA-directed RNA polymerase subunit H (RpoH/RPB5)
MNHEELDVLFRSRKTILKILNEDGYDTTKYETFGPWEIEAMVAAGYQALFMEVKRKEPEEGRPNICRVIYSLTKLKQRVNTFIDEIKESKEIEFVVIVLEDVADVFHAAALKSWVENKVRVRFFKAHNLIFDPREHILVPPHTKLPATEHAEFLKANYIRSKGNLPFIRFHEDMIARIMGLLPGDIVKITRPSPASGVYDIYRVCVP